MEDGSPVHQSRADDGKHAFQRGLKPERSIESSVEKIAGGGHVHEAVSMRLASVQAMDAATARRYAAPQPDCRRDNG